MKRLVIDTHALIYWLLKPASLTENARAWLINVHVQKFVPTFVLLEVKYLIEIGRIEASIDDFLIYINTTTSWQLVAFDEMSLVNSFELSDKRDPFDRTILSTALSMNCNILTKDAWMCERYKKCVW